MGKIKRIYYKLSASVENHAHDFSYKDTETPIRANHTLVRNHSFKRTFFVSAYRKVCDWLKNILFLNEIQPLSSYTKFYSDGQRINHLVVSRIKPQCNQLRKNSISSFSTMTRIFLHRLKKSL